MFPTILCLCGWAAAHSGESVDEIALSELNNVPYIGFSWIQVEAKPAFIRLYGEELQMTQLEVRFRYGAAPGEAEMRAIDSMRDVYGIRRLLFDEKERILRVEFDASRMKTPVVASLLRRAGIDLREQLIVA
jgi:hypothetical protein